MRMMSLILTELAADKLKAEQQLELLLNSKDADIDDRVEKIKEALKKVVQCNLMIERWQNEMGTSPLDNENNDNQ